MHTKGRMAGLIAVLAASAMFVAACGSSSPKSSTTTTTAAGGSTTTAATDSSLAGLTGTLTGGGSSFQDAFEQRAISDFTTALKTAGSSATVVYQKSGSGTGKQQLAADTLDYAGSDSTIGTSDTALYPKASSVLYFPIVAAPITVSYNLPGVAELKLDPVTLAKIFMGTVTSWNDPAIAADNSGVTLPSTKIAVVVRSDASGTTSNFSKYLAAAEPTIFTPTPGQTVAWPGANVQKAASSSGVATTIQNTVGAVGYVDLSDAIKAKLVPADIKNSAGNYIKPTTAAAALAVGAATVKPDLTYNPLNSSGAQAYPITSPTWILVYKTQTDPAKAALLKAFLKYVLTTEQSVANLVLYAPLPTSLATLALNQISQITG